MKRFKDYRPDQQLLLPPDLNEWREEGHLAYFISDGVGKLDLCQIYDDYHSQRGGQPAPAPRGRIPQGTTVRQRMARKLRTKKGRAAYAKRQQTVEPVFGQIKQAQGFRRFLLRGLEPVWAEWRLICLGHNLLKLLRSGALSALT